ncbi:MAG: type II secretion system protein [Planctomycetota bacterium]|nr:type II secretion system protein [Planctomycetota bacterium]
MRPTHAIIWPVDRPRGASGFTLIELLVTLAVIGVLIAILAPTLRSSRDQAIVTRSQSLLRQFSTSLGAYGADERDQFPYLGTPGKPNGPALARGANIRAYRTVPGGYFGAHTTFWVNVFDDRDLPPPKEYTYDPLLPDLPERVLASKVKLTANVAAAPEYFTDDAYKRIDLDEDPLLRSVRWTEVRDPARKGTLLDTRAQLWNALNRSGGARAISVTRADGGAMVFRLPPPTDGPEPWVFVSYSAQWRVLSTRDGVRGIDFP